MLSAFTATLNAIDRGCCLPEAIAASINHVDEWIFLDGGSTDATMDVLIHAKKLWPTKIVTTVWKEAWEGRANKGERIQQAYEAARQLCRSQILVMIQADEIITGWDKAQPWTTGNSWRSRFLTVGSMYSLVKGIDWTGTRVRCAMNDTRIHVGEAACNLTSLAPEMMNTLTFWNIGFLFSQAVKVCQNRTMHCQKNEPYMVDGLYNPPVVGMLPSFFPKPVLDVLDKDMLTYKPDMEVMDAAVIHC